KLRRGRIGRLADPGCTQLRGQFLMALAVTRADVHLGSAGARNLDGDMSGRPEPVEPDARPRPAARRPVEPGQAQGAIADDPRAKQRRRLKVVESCGQPVREGGRRDDLLRVAAIHGPTRELARLAQVLASVETVATDAARAMQPGDADAVTRP